MTKKALILIFIFFTIIVSQKITAQDFIITTHLGFSNRTADVPTTNVRDVDNLFEDLSSGRSFDIAGKFLLKNKKLTLGLRYNNFSSDSSQGILTGSTSINFIGATIGYYNTQHKGIGMFNAELGLGYTDYETKVKSNVIINTTESGSTFGASVSMGFDFKITKNIYLGPSFDILTGTVSEVDLDINGIKSTQTLEGEDRISLLRWDLNAKLTFMF